MSPDLGSGSIWPGLIVPAAILIVALLSAATVIYLSAVRDAGDDKGGGPGPAPGA